MMSPGDRTTTRTARGGSRTPQRSERTSNGYVLYDLRHAYASLPIRAGLSIPELAERLGHSPQMTVMTYTDVIRELEGEPRVSAAEQSERPRRGGETNRAQPD
jgi:integrase